MVQDHAYTDGIYGKRVLLIGTLPPPYGGVSVHVERTKQKLERQRNRVQVFDPESIYLAPWMRRAIFKYGAYFWYLVRFVSTLVWWRPAIIMYHISYARHYLLELLLLVSLKKVYKSKILLIDHDCRHMALRSSRWIIWYQKLLKSVDTIIVIGSVTAHSYAQRGITHVQVESAFLPPDTAQRHVLMTQYPDSLITFMRTHHPCIIMNAYQCVMWNGVDLYGLDQAVHALALLRHKYPQVGLVILLSVIGDAASYAQLLQLIAQLQVRDHIYILQGNYQLWPLFSLANLFIRPTRSDGASVSVQEALHGHISVVASDVCWRPQGVVTYRSGQVHDLYINICTLLDSKGFVHDNQQHHNLHP